MDNDVWIESGLGGRENPGSIRTEWSPDQAVRWFVDKILGYITYGPLIYYDSTAVTRISRKIATFNIWNFQPILKMGKKIDQK